VRIRGRFGRKELAAEARLLRRSRVGEGEEHRIEPFGVDASYFPAGVVVARGSPSQR
jgi:hypothetical protein